MARRMFRRAGVSVEIEATGDLREAVRGASYVLAQIRVGKMPARILDEKIPCGTACWGRRPRASAA